MKITVRYNQEEIVYSIGDPTYKNWIGTIALDFIRNHHIEDPCQLFLYKDGYFVDHWQIQENDILDAVVKTPQQLLFFNPSILYRKWNKTFDNDYQYEAIWINYINNCYNIYLIGNIMKDTLVCETEGEARQILTAYNASQDVFQRLDQLSELT